MNKTLKRGLVATTAVLALAGTAAIASSHKPAVRTNTVYQTVDHTVSVNVTPPACATAISEYKAIGVAESNLFGDFVGEMGPALQAGLDQSPAEISNITTQVTGFNTQLDNLLPQVKQANNDAALCES
jgi:hypothetical protein